MKSSFEEQPTVALVSEPEVGELAFVVWRDATGTTEWTTRKRALKAKAEKCHSVGWILRIDEKQITLASDRWAEPKGQVAGITVIPADWVQEIIPVVLGD